MFRLSQRITPQMEVLPVCGVISFPGNSNCLQSPGGLGTVWALKTWETLAIITAASLRDQEIL
jgi:hypothetical protein